MNKRTSLIWRILAAVLGIIGLCCGALYGLGKLTITYPGAVLWTLVGLWLVTPLGIAILYGRLRDRLARHSTSIQVEPFKHDGMKGWTIEFCMQEKEDPDTLPEVRQ